jgi:streptomycin 6-kinase
VSLDKPQIPENVLTGVQARWPDRAERWATTAPDVLRDLCDRYGARPRSVLNARYGFVVVADTSDGGLVFRSSPDPDGSTQAAVAAALAGLGVGPAIHETISTEVDTWTVMEEVRPGTPFALVDHETVDLESLAAPLAALKDQPVPVPGMLSVFDWLRERLENDNLTELPSWMEPAPPAERQDALRILDDLAQGHTPQLCHGDASTWNLLAIGGNRWTLIDPRGVSGEVDYDVAVLASKTRTGQDHMIRLSQFATAAGIHRDRASAWAIVAATARV